MVNGAPREVPKNTQWSPSGEYLRSPGGFNMQGQSPREILRGTFNILPRDSISTCGTSQGGPLTMIALRVSHRFSCASAATALWFPIVSYTMLHS